MFIKDHNKIFKLLSPRSLKFIYQPIKGVSLFSNKNFKQGENIISLNGYFVLAKHASPESVQYNETTSIDSHDYIPEDFINHSCSPNSFIDWNKKNFVAIRNILKNTEITFDYNTSEYDMKKFSTHFACVCASKNCYRNVLGFKYLTKKQKEKIRLYLSPFLLSKLN